MLKRYKKYSFLFQELVHRDFTKKYKRTALGIGWSVLSPLLQLLVMKIMLTKFFATGIEHYTTFLFAGNTKKTTTVKRNEIRDDIFLENTNIYLGTFTLEMIAEFSANAVIPELVDSL